jgi:DNA polymerase (family 10)
MYFTGSKAHNVALHGISNRHGWKLNEYALFDKRNRRLAGETGAQVYDKHGMPFIAPELRRAPSRPSQRSASFSPSPCTTWRSTAS